MRRFLAFITWCMMLFGCKTAEPVLTTDTLYINSTVVDTIYKAKIDSIYVQDSIYIHQKGDTVYSEKWHIRNRVKIDTLYRYIEKTDTVYRSQTLTKEVERELTWWQKIRQSIGGVVILALLLLIVSYVYRKFLHK